MVCHYCGHSQPLPKNCPVCSKDDSIVYMGAGKQMLESSLSKNFPGIRIARMDADTTNGKFSHEKILDTFRNGKADVLVGTQMVAKGHDFPKVSLVGIINADTSLYLNDYRANEKTFSLLTQVLGRAGRAGKKGRAVIQTYSPDNDILRLAGLQDYNAFYDREILFRKASLFPPFCDIVTVTFSGLVESDVINAVKQFGQGIDQKAKTEYSDVKFILFGPFKTEVYKVSGKYRMRFIIKCANNAKFRKMLSELITKYMGAFKDVTVSADVNPTNL
jgi:primosomal protein N' (replication factor Y)